jgi:hypothetical protein
MMANKSVTANFGYPLSVVKAGIGLYILKNCLLKSKISNCPTQRTRRVGLPSLGTACAFSSTLCGFKWVPAKWRYLVPQPPVTPAVGWLFAQ